LREAGDGDGLTVLEHYVLKDAWTRAGGSTRRLDLYSEQIGSEVTMPETMTRSAPLALSHPLAIEHVAKVKLPKGWRWLGDPYRLEVDDPAFHYEASTSNEEGTVTWQRQYRTRRSFVAVPDLPAHLKARREIYDDLNRRILAEPPTAISDRERSERLKGLMRSIMDEKSPRRDPGSQ